MTTVQHDDSAASGWLLKITAVSAPADPGQFERQTQQLRSIAGFDPASRTWTCHVGVLNAQGMKTLQAAFDAASEFGTRVRVEWS